MDVTIQGITDAEVAVLTTRMNRSNAERVTENVRRAAQVPPGVPLTIPADVATYVQDGVKEWIAAVVSEERRRERREQEEIAKHILDGVSTQEERDRAAAYLAALPPA